MGQIFQSFIGGLAAGQENQDRRRTRNALDDAGAAYQAGNADEAENILVGAGMTAEAANMTALNQARRRRAAQQSATQAMGALPQTASMADRYQAGRDAVSTGDNADMELMANLDDAYRGASQEQRQQAAVLHDGIANFMLGQIDRGVPVEQRQADATAHAQEFAERTGAPLESVQQMIAGVTDWSDQAHRATAQQNQTAAQHLAEMTRQGERGEDIARQESQFNRELALRREALDNPRQRPFTALQVSNARANFAAADSLSQSLENYAEMVRTASPQALAGIGPEGAALESARTLLSIQAKSPAALDLGALVGADFTLLGNTVGSDDWGRLIRQGGREGALQRLEPFRQFLRQSQDRLRTQYEPWQDQMPEFFAETPQPEIPRGGPGQRGPSAAFNQPVGDGAPPSSGGGGGSPVRVPTAARSPRVGAIVNGYRFRGGDPNSRNNWEHVSQQQPGNYRGR